MNDFPLTVLFGILFLLFLLSSFFSSSETGLMAINRYRLRHRADTGDRHARRIMDLLRRPDRMMGIILLGNNFVNNLAASLVSVIAIQTYGETAIPIAAFVLTLVMLIFCEVAPKTYAALSPEKIAYPASMILRPLLLICWPMVWLVNLVSNSVLKMVGLSSTDASRHALDPDELRSVVMEAGRFISKSHQTVLLRILELEGATVEDVMVPRNEIEGIDLEQDWETIRQGLINTHYTCTILYRGNVDRVEGFVHMRKVLNGMAEKPDFNRQDLVRLIEEVYYIPEETPLNTQMLNFQQQKQRRGLVVDEYGDILGLVTLEDILEEIVGEFTTVPGEEMVCHYQKQADGRYRIEGSAAIRVLNRELGWELPTDGPKTLNGLIMEYLEAIPEPGSILELAGHRIEIVDVDGNRVKSALVEPQEEGKE